MHEEHSIEEDDSPRSPGLHNDSLDNVGTDGEHKEPKIGNDGKPIIPSALNKSKVIKPVAAPTFQPKLPQKYLNEMKALNELTKKHNRLIAELLDK
jgi:hypothetical protein